MRALVTGGGGFLGGYLRARLAREGVDIHRVTVRRGEQGENIHHLGDVTETDALRRVLKSVRPDYVFHLAGVMTADDPTLYCRVNTLFAVALLEALEREAMGSTPTLLMGTAAEYGPVRREDLPLREDRCATPHDLYGISKLAQSHAGLRAARQGLSVVVVRPFNVIGVGMPRHLAIQSFASQIGRVAAGETAPEIRVGNLAPTRDLVDAADVIEACWLLVRKREAYGEIVNICTGIGTSMQWCLERLIALSGTDVAITVDAGLFKGVDHPEHYGSVEKLRRLAGYVPATPVENTLEAMLREACRCP